MERTEDTKHRVFPHRLYAYPQTHLGYKRGFKLYMDLCPYAEQLFFFFEISALVEEEIETSVFNVTFFHSNEKILMVILDDSEYTYDFKRMEIVDTLTSESLSPGFVSCNLYESPYNLEEIIRSKNFVIDMNQGDEPYYCGTFNDLMSFWEYIMIRFYIPTTKSANKR